MVSEAGCLEDIINFEMKKMIFTGNIGKSSNKNKGVPFVLTYHPLLKKVNCIIRKHINLLYMNEGVKKVFQPGPMGSFRSPKNLSRYLLRAKLLQWKGKQDLVNARVTGVRYVSMYLKWEHLAAQ